MTGFPLDFDVSHHPITVEPHRGQGEPPLQPATVTRFAEGIRLHLLNHPARQDVGAVALDSAPAELIDWGRGEVTFESPPCVGWTRPGPDTITSSTEGEEA